MYSEGDILTVIASVACNLRKCSRKPGGNFLRKMASGLSSVLCTVGRLGKSSLYVEVTLVARNACGRVAGERSVADDVPLLPLATVVVPLLVPPSQASSKCSPSFT